jgi:hypothetical protein
MNDCFVMIRRCCVRKKRADVNFENLEIVVSCQKPLDRIAWPVSWRGLCLMSKHFNSFSLFLLPTWQCT